MTALEAALSGNALVLGDIDSLHEVWGDAAVFVDPERPAELAAAINRLIDDSTLRAKLAQSARLRARQLSAAAMVDGYTKLYREIITTGSSTLMAEASSSGGS